MLALCPLVAVSNPDTLPNEDDAPWLDCMDGFKASIEDDEPLVLADDGYPAELGDFVIT